MSSTIISPCHLLLSYIPLLIILSLMPSYQFHLGRPFLRFLTDLNNKIRLGHCLSTILFRCPNTSASLFQWCWKKISILFICCLISLFKPWYIIQSPPIAFLRLKVFLMETLTWLSTDIKKKYWYSSQIFHPNRNTYFIKISVNGIR